MKSFSKLLLIGVSLIVLAVTVMVVVFSVDAGRRSLDQFDQFIAQMFGKAGEPAFAKYSGQYVDGKTVRSTMEEFGGDFFISVKTKKNPVSFVVAHKPVDHTIMVDYSGEPGMLSYVNSSSLCYVNENALFSAKVIRDSGNTLLGITFTEKGAGAVTEAVRKTYTPANPSATITQVKTSYIDMLKNVVAASNVNSMVANTNSRKNFTKQLEAETMVMNGNLYPPVEGGADNSAYQAAVTERDVAQAAVDSAWVSLMEQCKNVTGVEPAGYYSISKNDPDRDLDDTSNLQFWANLFNERDAS